MQNRKAYIDVDKSLDQLDRDVRKLTGILVDLVKDDREWWVENAVLLASQPLNSLKKHLEDVQDGTLKKWDLSLGQHVEFSVLDPVESLVWLAGLCNLDKLLLGVLPRAFIDEFLLQWRVLAVHWVFLEGENRL